MAERDQQEDSRDTPAAWGGRVRTRSTRPPARALIASVLLHAFILAAFWFAGLTLAPEPDFVQYRVTLVSPPPQEQGEPEPVTAPETPVVVEPEPEPEPPAPEPEPEPEVPKPAPPEPASTPPETRTPPEREPEPEPKPTRGREPDPRSPGGDNLKVRQEGEEFPYQDYLDNIVRTLHNYFRWNGSPNLEAEVVFYIRRDGTPGGIRIVQKSGNFQFDLQAHEAVDRAGRAGAFGPLPDGWQEDRLWISFTFEPAK